MSAVEWSAGLRADDMTPVQLSVPQISSMQLMPRSDAREAPSSRWRRRVPRLAVWPGAASGTGSGWNGRAFDALAVRGYLAVTDHRRRGERNERPHARVPARSDRHRRALSVPGSRECWPAGPASFNIRVLHSITTKDWPDHSSFQNLRARSGNVRAPAWNRLSGKGASGPYLR
jgi:hypothetical protein